MPRRYDSSRRRQAAERTRRDILEAALRLHWEGVTEFEPLARAAGCSPATVRKHFPTKEDLYRSCTRTFGESLELPDLEALSATEDEGERLDSCVSELCRIHEAMFGYAWHSAHLRQGSAVLDSVMANYEALADAIAGIVVDDNAAGAPLVRSLLDFLTYRAMRHSGGLSPEETRTALVHLISSLTIPQLPDPKRGARK